MTGEFAIRFVRARDIGDSNTRPMCQFCKRDLYGDDGYHLDHDDGWPPGICDECLAALDEARR